MPVLFALGPPARVGALLEEIAAEPRLYLMVQPEILPMVQARWAVKQPTAMWRMILDAGNFRPPPAPGTVRLSPQDLPALRALYEDGVTAGEAPDFFDASMIERGIF